MDERVTAAFFCVSPSGFFSVPLMLNGDVEKVYLFRIYHHRIVSICMQAMVIQTHQDNLNPNLLRNSRIVKNDIGWTST